MKWLLIVEDDDVTRRALAASFIREGWDVADAASVTEGLALLDHGQPPDFAVVDLMLPDGGGERILVEFKARGLPTRVAVCTGCEDLSRLAVVEALGPAAILHKPIRIEDVHAACAAPLAG